MRKLDQKIAGLGRTTEPQPDASTLAGGGCGEKAVADLRRFLKVGSNVAAMTPIAAVGAEPTAEEGLRLIKAFLRVAGPRQRQWLIDQAEAMAECGPSQVSSSGRTVGALP